MDNENFKKEIVKRFDAVIKLLTISSMKDNSQKEKISLLDSTGFSPKEISEILNTSSNSVSVTLNKLKKKPKKKEKEVTENDQSRGDGEMEREEEIVNTTPIPDNQREEEAVE